MPVHSGSILPSLLSISLCFPVPASFRFSPCLRLLSAVLLKAMQEWFLPISLSKDSKTTQWKNGQLRKRVTTLVPKAGAALFVQPLCIQRHSSWLSRRQINKSNTGRYIKMRKEVLQATVDVVLLTLRQSHAAACHRVCKHYSVGFIPQPWRTLLPSINSLWESPPSSKQAQLRVWSVNWYYSHLRRINVTPQQVKSRLPGLWF